MAVSLTRITGKGTFKGINTNLGSYRVTEDATPRVSGDTSGGVGSIGVDVLEDEGTILFSGNIIELEDTSISAIQGIVREISLSDGESSLTADTLLAKLTVSRTAAPFHGTIAQAAEYYLGLVGITGDYAVDSSFASRQVVYPGYYGNVWTFLKNMAAAEQFEIASVENAIVFRPIRQFKAKVNEATINLDVATDDIALTAGVYNYNTEWVTNSTVYPIAGDSPPVIEVNSGETVVQVIKTDVSLESILPLVVTTDADLAAWQGAPQSSYFVHDGYNVVHPFRWADLGGKITLEIDPEDSTQIIVTVRGAVDPTVATWRIASAVDNGDESFTFVNGLIVTGTGVRTRKELVTVPTGADPVYVAEDSAPTVDNPCIRNKAQAYTAALQVASAHAGPYLSFSSRTDRMKTAGADNVYGNPKFGEIAGARIAHRGSSFRIKSVTASATGLDYSAERDTMIEDFNEVWEGMTFDDFNDMWAGKTFDEFSVAPLRR